MGFLVPHKTGHCTEVVFKCTVGKHVEMRLPLLVNIPTLVACLHWDRQAFEKSKITAKKKKMPENLEIRNSPKKACIGLGQDLKLALLKI